MSDAATMADGQMQSSGIHTDELRRKAVTAGQAVVDLAGEARNAAVTGASQMTSQAKDWVASKTDAIKQRAQTVHVSTIAYVRENPYKALAMAAGAGVLVGMILRLRGRD